MLSDRKVTSLNTELGLEISDRSWRTMSDLVKILEPAKSITDILCAENASASNIRPMLQYWMENCLKVNRNDESLIRRLKKTISEKLSTHFFQEKETVDVRMVATFLDPRYKNLTHEDQHLKDKIRHHVKSLLNGAEMNEITAIDEIQLTKRYLDFSKIFKSASPPQRMCQFRSYQQCQTLDFLYCPFSWWKNNESRYPDVAGLAKKYLCIPATSASSERCFSTAGNIASAKRSCLLPENLDLLVFLNNNKIFIK